MKAKLGTVEMMEAPRKPMSLAEQYRELGGYLSKPIDLDELTYEAPSEPLLATLAAVRFGAGVAEHGDRLLHMTATELRREIAEEYADIVVYTAALRRRLDVHANV